MFEAFGISELVFPDIEKSMKAIKGVLLEKNNDGVFLLPVECVKTLDCTNLTHQNYIS